jgi:tRNA(fMet)-specific endonuclease VapC
MGLILDTNFIIAAERDARKAGATRTDDFLARRASESFFITFTVAGELACGQSASIRGDWERLCKPFPILPWTIEIAWCYGEVYRQLAARGALIGANDMWIAATALASGNGLVTNNTAEFCRVPGLSIEAF